jgi:lantibiotic leader peptide-processing serine protease
VLTLAFVGTASAAKYIVLYKAHGVPADGGAKVRAAGGTVVASYAQIGVIVAESTAPDFVAKLSEDNRVERVAISSRPVAHVGPVEAESHEGGGDLPNTPAADADTFSPLQWDMRQIHAPEAHAITGGSPAVVVGDIDTGLDKDHPDLIPNIDFSRSVSCESGAPNQAPAAWDDRNGHGTHTAGTIAAASNGIGIVGVAPNVKVAGIKSSNDDGFFFVEMVVCSFMWAATHQIDVTNNSYFMDPYLYNCRNDASQRALWKAAKRAIDYSQKKGVLSVASLGNDSDDRAHPAFDVTSPDFPPGSEEEREITNACVVVPVEVDGVVGVSAVGSTRQTDDDDDPNDYLKSFYSSYGMGVTEVTAPGGDSVFFTPESVNGRVLSTYPAERPCTRRREEPGVPAAAYCYLQGTSMAAPHAAGVAALIISMYGDLNSPQNGKMRPGAVAAMLQQTADAQPCPTELPAAYANFPRPHFEGAEEVPQECQGGPGHNSWYGAGQINALRAVSHDTGS